jgi:dihydropteroate synthase
VNAWAVAAGASIVRVHEVAPAVAVVRMVAVIAACGRA